MKTKNVCLIQVDISLSSGKLIPYGILELGSYLENNTDFIPYLFHIHYKKIEDTVEEIIKLNPLYVGISTMTGEMCFYSALLSKKIKQKTNIPIVWGGVHPSSIPNQCISEDYIDIIGIGEGELIVKNLAEAIYNDLPLKNVKGIAYKEEGKVIFNEREKYIEDLSCIQHNFDLLGDLNKYLRKMWHSKRVINYITSRGCPFNCAFCYNTVDKNRRKWRGIPIETVKKDIEFLKTKYNIDGIQYHDDNFFVDKKRAVEIVNYINLPWWGELRIESIKESLISELVKTGCKELLFGWESGNNNILKLMNKQIKVNQIIEANKILANFPEICYDGQSIIFVPTETEEQVKQTIKLAYKLVAINSSISCNLLFYQPFPGTPLYNLSVKHGLKEPENTEAWKSFNSRNINRKFSWIPWLTNRKKKKYSKIQKYFTFYTKSYYQNRANNLFTKFSGFLFYYFAKFRIKFNFYYFPFEIFIWKFKNKLGN